MGRCREGEEVKFRSSTFYTLMDELAQLTPEEVSRVDNKFTIPLKRFAEIITGATEPVSYAVEDASPGDLINDDTITDDDWRVGLEECIAGRVAIVFLVNSIEVFDVIPGLGMPVIVHLINQSRASALGRDADIPVIVAVPERLLSGVKSFLAPWAFSGISVRVVGRPSTLAAEPLGGLLKGPDGHFKTTHTGTGDVWDTLVSSGIADEFSTVTNFLVHTGKNGLWSPHLGILGQHVKASGKITVEVGSDDVGEDLLPCRYPCHYNGKLVIADSHDFSDDEDYKFSFVSLDSYIISRDVLSAPIDWRFRKRRTMLHSGIAHCVERSIEQLTHLHETRMVYVDRELRFHSARQNMLESLGKFLAKSD